MGSVILLFSLWYDLQGHDLGNLSTMFRVQNVPIWLIWGCQLIFVFWGFWGLVCGFVHIYKEMSSIIILFFANISYWYEGNQHIFSSFSFPQKLTILIYQTSPCSLYSPFIANHVKLVTNPQIFSNHFSAILAIPTKNTDMTAIFMIKDANGIGYMIKKKPKNALQYDTFGEDIGGKEKQWT